MASGIVPPAPFLAVLRQICARLEGTAINWAVTGSMGFALQGFPVEDVHDIDLQTDAAGAYEIEVLFSDAVIRRVAYSAAGTIRSHFGALLLEGIQVEIMGEVSKRRGEHLPWEAPVDLEQVKRWVSVDGMSVPVLDLEYECEAYRILGRVERSERLRIWLDGQR